MPSLSEFERLFLLEFFVDYVTIQNGRFDNADSTLCVSFQFLHYPVMRVCEEEFKQKSKPALTEDSTVPFKSGKSCLFSVHPDENNKISSKFNLVIAVCQKKRGCDSRSLIGQAAVNLGNSFLNLLQTPVSGPFESNFGVKYELFPLKDKFKRVVGSVAAFARLSNFGKMIITQFQLAAEDTSSMNYMFKGTDPKKLFKDDPMLNFPLIETEPPPVQQAKPCRPPSLKPKPCRPPPIVKETDDEESSSESDDSDETETDEEEETKKQEAQKDALKPEDDEDYKEIEAEINGHSITVHVARKKKAPKVEISPQECCCPEPPICPYAPKLNTCDCDYPLPPQLMPRCKPQCCASSAAQSMSISLQPSPSLPLPPPPPQAPPLPEKSPSSLQRTQSVPISPSQEQIDAIELPVCPREDCPLGLYSPTPPPDPMDLEPGCVAMKGDQVFFQMTNRPAGEPVNEKEKKQASSVYYKVGATEAGKEVLNSYIQITPQGPLEPLVDSTVKGPVSGLPIDTKYDMFLFKVLKQNDTESAKCKLEMELRTPKEKEIKPPTNTQDTQYLVTDFPPVEKKGKKNKNEKGGGGKKGKKK